MPINQTEDKEYLFQQTFMGASIVGWNATMVFNSNSSSININLVEDDQNKRKSNAMDEGYHIWDKEKGFPTGGTPNYKSAGDIFESPVVGSPGYFTYYKSNIKNCGECGRVTGEFGTFTAVEDPKGLYKNKEDCEAASLVWKGPPNENKLKEERAGNIESIFEFNGIVKNFKRNVGSSGTRYSVTLEDPRLMLEGTQVILDGFESPTPPADASYNIITKFRNGEYKNRRYYKYGAIGYYNILNPFGFYEWFQFGAADVTQNGMSWVKILDALATITKGRYDIWTDDEGEEYNLERFGGPLYYVKDSREDQVMKASEPVNVHRYQVDLTEMYNLHTSQGGPLGDDFRIKAESMSFLSLLQEICETAGADFFVELVTKKEDGITPIAEKKQHKKSHYSGIIKVIPIPRNSKIVPGQIQKEIDTATAQSKLTEESDSDCTQGEATHQWAKRIVSTDMGYEFKDPVSGVMLVGAPRTRVVGVTAMGWWPNIKAGMIRKRFAVGNDKLKEFMPAIELDGVTFSNPGWYHPHYLPDLYRAGTGACDDCPGGNNKGLSVDQVNPITGAMWNVRNPFAPVSNDDTIAWQHSLTAAPIMRNVFTGLAQLNDIPHVPANFQLAGTSPLGDGMIDLYPCWGFMRGIDKFKGDFKVSTMLGPKNDGIPIKGRYNDDDAYRDFDTNDGIFSIFEYYNPDFGSKFVAAGPLGMGPCVEEPYHGKCPANIQPKVPALKSENNRCSSGENETYRYRLANKRFRQHDGALMSFNFITPKTATIPINLYGTGWNGGPVSADIGDFSHYYYATVTELRAAITGFESWMEYTQIFAPWLHCGLATFTCPLIAGRGGGRNLMRDGNGCVTHHFNRLLGVVGGIAPDIDFDGRPDLPKGEKLDYYLLQEVFSRVSAVASSFYGKQYLMALPFTPPDASQHIRRISEVAFEYEQKWNISTAGWVDVRFDDQEMGKRYPHNINFYDNSGNLEPFVVYPSVEKKRIEKTHNRIYVEAEAQPSSSQTVHVTSLADSLGGGSLGKTFVKASVDPNTYWLWNESTYDIQTRKVNKGTMKPYALITTSSPAKYSDSHDAINPAIKIPTRSTDGRYLFNANFWYFNFTGRFFVKNDPGFVGKKAKDDQKKWTIADAYYKPWTAAVPQESTRYTWGPWALGTGFGKAKYDVDTSFHPAAFGSFDNMEIAGIERCKAAVEPDQHVSGWAIEKGTIVLAGLPSPKDGDGSSRRIMGRQLMGQGPYITDISLDITPAGITTTYNMQTQRKFGKLPEIYENRMRQRASDIVKTLKDLGQLERRER